MTHTPKPWKIITEAEGFAGATTGKDLGIIDKDGNIIAEVFHQLDDDLFAPVEANARLIAKAPELYDLLNEWLDTPFFETKEDWQKWVDDYKPRVETTMKEIEGRNNAST